MDADQSWLFNRICDAYDIPDELRESWRKNKEHRMGKLRVVVGGQFGSEGKGAVAAYLASHHSHRGISIRVAGPNAGHTVIGRCPPDCSSSSASAAYDPGLGGHGPDRHPWRLQQVPVAAVSKETDTLVIAAGSEIDLSTLAREVTELESAGYKVHERLFVHPQATLIEDRHAQQESYFGLIKDIGSTGKGVGAARAYRLWREAALAGSEPDLCKLNGPLLDTMIREHIDAGGDVLIEGTQGYGLGLHAGHYPYVTTSDCRAIDFLAMAGISPWQVHPHDLEVWVVYRAHPIRVAGNSGPLPNETTWEELGLPAELTTVTRKIRRVGEWDSEASRDAALANGAPLPTPTGIVGQRGRYYPVRAALTMADHLVPACAGATSMDKLEPQVRGDLSGVVVDRLSAIGVPIELIGTGPATMIDLRSDR